MVVDCRGRELIRGTVVPAIRTTVKKTNRITTNKTGPNNMMKYI